MSNNKKDGAAEIGCPVLTKCSMGNSDPRLQVNLTMPNPQAAASRSGPVRELFCEKNAQITQIVSCWTGLDRAV